MRADRMRMRSPGVTKSAARSDPTEQTGPEQQPTINVRFRGKADIDLRYHCIGFLSGYAPRADANQQISTPRNVTDVIFELAAVRAFDGARRDLHEEAQAFDRRDYVRTNMGRDRQG